MSSVKKLISVFIAVALVFSSLPITFFNAGAAEPGDIAADSSLIIKRPMASLQVSDVTRVAYQRYSMRQPTGSDSVIVKATPSGMPELSGNFVDALAYAGETPVSTQITFTPGVELETPPTVSCNNTTVTFSDYVYSNGSYTWTVTGGTAVVGTTLLFDVAYSYTDYNAITDKYYTNTYHSYGTTYMEAIAMPAGEYSTKRTYEEFGLGQSTKNRSYVASYILGANSYGGFYDGGSGSGSVNFESTGSEPGWTGEYGMMKDVSGQSANRDYNICFQADSNRPLTNVYYDKSIHSSLSDLNLRIVTANLSEAGNSNERVTVRLVNTYSNIGITDTFSAEDDDGDPTIDSIATSQLGLTGYDGSITGPGAAFPIYFTGSGNSSTVGTTDYTVAVRYQTSADWSNVYVGHSHSLRIVTYDKGALRTLIETIQGSDPDVMTTDVVAGGFKGYNPQEWYYSAGWEAFFNAYKAAMACLNTPNVSQTEIDEKYSALKSAYDALEMRTADYSIVSAYYTQAMNKDRKFYTLASWAKVQNILDKFISNFSSIYQPAADKLAADLKLALDSLEEATADYTEFYRHLNTINNLISRSEATYGMPASQAYNYWSELEAALRKSGCIYDELDGYVVAAPLLISQQATVDGYVLLLERAINKLSLTTANYTEAAKAESAYKLININYVTDETAAGLTSAYNALIAVHGLDLSNQAKVDAATANLNEWLAKVQYKPADITAAQEMLLRAANIDRTLYSDMTAVDEAVEELEATLTLDIRYQNRINRATSALQSAIDSLLKNSADYSSVDDAIAAVNEREHLIKDTYADTYGFTAQIFYSNWSAVENAMNAVQRGLDLTQQTTVNAYATAILNALASLQESVADYSAVNELQDEAYNIVSTGTGLYTAASLQNLTSVYISVVANKKISEQATVDGYAAAIEEAIEALEYLPASYASVQTQYALAQTEIARDESYREAHPGYSYYTADSLSVLNVAIASVVDGLDIRYTETVEGYAQAIADAIAQLECSGADYTQVDFAISTIPADLSIYTTLSVATLNATVKGVNRTYTADKQSTVDTYVTKINNAVKSLKYKTADYSSVQAALKKVPADSSIYTSESWQYLQDQINAVVYNLDITRQEEVDVYAVAIEQAIEFLSYEKADYTSVRTAIETARAEINKGIYTDESVQRVESAIDAVVYDYPAGRQEEVNSFAAAINTAVGKLVERGADYTAVDNAVKIANEKIETGYYTDDTVAQLQAAIDAVVPNLPLSRQEEVTAFAVAITEATNRLIEKLADYTAVSDAKELANQKIATGYYTDDTVAALQAAIDAVEPDYPISRQTEVQAFADEITAKITALTEKPADYSAVVTAKELARAEIEKGIYTQISIDELQAAIDAVEPDYPISRQAEVLAFADAIDAARLALDEIPANYTAVDNAITEARAKIDTGYYTDETVALLEAEIAKVDYSLGMSRQSEVEQFAQNIVKFTNELELGLADYTELQNILYLLDNSSSEIYTITYTNLDEVLALINSYRENTIVPNMNITADRQSEVNEMTATLQGYLNMLERAPEKQASFEFTGTAVTKKQGGVTYVYGLQPKLTKALFQKNFAEYENVTLEYEMTTTRYLGTGSKVTVKSTLDDSVIGEYVIVIYGDVDGNAVIDANDAVAVLMSTTGATGALTGAEKLAANLAGTRNIIDAGDVEAITSIVSGGASVDQATGKLN